jgi:hypothetical protein
MWRTSQKHLSPLRRNVNGCPVLLATSKPENLKFTRLEHECLIKKQELFTLHKHLDSPPGIYVVRVAHHFSFLSCFACLFVFHVFVPCFCVQSCMCLLFINSWLRIRVSLFSLFIYFIIKVELSLVRKLNDIPNCLPLFLEQLRKLRTKVNIRILQMLQ